jgi:hypothetical protein
MKLMTPERLNDFSAVIFKKYNEDLSNFPYKERPADSRFISDEVNYALQYARYYAAGRNLFHFEPDIVEKFRKTDVDEVPLSALMFPYEIFYLSFGKQEDLNLWNKGFFVDGAYVTGGKPGFPLEIILTTIRNDLDINDRLGWITNPDRYYYLAIDTSDSDLAVAEAIDETLKEELQSIDLRNQPDESGTVEIGDRKIYLRDNRQNSSAANIMEKETGFTTFREALRLIINGLCYLTSYNEEIVTGWSEDTPPLLVDSIAKAETPNKKRKLKSELISKGYVTVNFCGKKAPRDNIEAISTDRELSTHWRRGHWRNQACGPRLQERKLIWIMPNPDKPEPKGKNSIHAEQKRSNY